MKRILFILNLAILIVSCGGEQRVDEGSGTDGQNAVTTTESTYDPIKGEGKFTTVELGESLNTEMSAIGEKIQSVKCSACHKLTEDRLVGPGWKGVTERRRPEWIMNFITNPDPMIDKDPVVQAQFELCLIRMPNQSLTDDDARAILEFMRKNDGLK